MFKALVELAKTNKMKIGVFVAAAVVYGICVFLGIEVDFSALFQGDVSGLGDTLENAAGMAQ